MEAIWHDFWEQLPAAAMLLVYAYGLFVVTWPLFLAIERWAPVAAVRPRGAYAFNWKIIASNALLTPVFYALTVTATASVARALGMPALPYPMTTWSAGLPVLDPLLQGIGFFAIAVFLNDLWYYAWHRMQHEIPALWELHKLHHSDEYLNATTIYRSHFFELPGQALVRGMTVGLLVDLGGTPESTLAIVMAGLLPPVWDFFIHAHVRLDSLHRLVPLLSNPQYHWIHHSKLPEHQNKNYAIWLPLFDVLLGTYYRPRPGEYPPTGLSSGEKIETLRAAQLGPFEAWVRSLAESRSG